MTKKNVALCIAFSLLSACSTAHDASSHKGTPFEGEIVEREPSKFTMMSKDGSHQQVVFKKRPNIEIGRAKYAETGALRKGQRVSVYGTKLPGGEIAADEVLVHTGVGH